MPFLYTNLLYGFNTVLLSIQVDCSPLGEFQIPIVAALLHLSEGVMTPKSYLSPSKVGFEWKKVCICTTPLPGLRDGVELVPTRLLWSDRHAVWPTYICETPLLCEFLQE